MTIDAAPIAASFGGACLRRRSFAAMGVGIECLVETDRSVEEALDAVEREFRRLEAIFTRFSPDSELSRLNRLGRLRCSQDLLEVVQLAIEARERTGGRFDPTVHDALLTAGYDRTFAEIPADSVGPDALPQACGGEITVDVPAALIVLGAGVRVDLGGIVKGYAAERGCELLEELGACLVNAAGDIAVRGVPEPGLWAIEVPALDGPITLGLYRGGLATSGRDYRRWRRNGIEQHHLIDPATGVPSTTDLVAVTAAGRDAVEAEVLAKALILAGERQALEEARRLQVACLLVTEDGRAVTAGALA